jgi:FkbM family methyltransferase
VPPDLKRGAGGVLRAARGAYAAAAGAVVAAVPPLERPFIRANRAIEKRSRILDGLYWYATESLLQRLRASDRRFRRVTLAGHDVVLDITDGSARLFYFHGIEYEPSLVRALDRLIAPGDVFVDIGANIGFFSVLAAQNAGPAGRVIAFEPHPGAREIFRAAIAINHLGGTIEIVEAAVGAPGPRSTRLFLTDNSMLSSTDPERAPLRDDYPFTSAIDVPLVTLDSWLGSRRELAPRIAAIKIDVEGTEADVLAGMNETLDACPGAAIICETDADGTVDRALRARGYTASPLDLWKGTFGNYLYER